MAEGSAGDALLRRIPQVDRLLGLAEFQGLVADYSLQEVTAAVRADQAALRDRGTRGTLTESDLRLASIRERVAQELATRARPYYCRVVNATGVVLHTGLGRAPLATEAVRAIADRAGRPVRVEIDLATGQRGGRERGCASLLEEITGCEAAAMVNNNAGATLLILSALARGKDVIVSRGELVEIGGSYRVPDIMQEGGAKLVEVGTTNRTHLADYTRAITDNTGMILKVHTSNYVVKGFTHAVDITALATLGQEYGIPVVHDLGSGCLVDLEKQGIPGEPFVPASVRSGADLVCFSGDKLLGGPQAGIILGRRGYVERCRKHPLYRALRLGRLSYLALEATLRLYREGEQNVLSKIPALRRLTARADELGRRAARLAEIVGSVEGIDSSVVSCTSQAGSGSLPTYSLESWALRLRPTDASVETLAAFLRQGSPAILARAADDALLFDVRTIDDEEFTLIHDVLQGWSRRLRR
ncbi:MAG: L-seryl-tRNA(Sec) selenium transferase [Planctomycetota bacterium]